MPPKFVLAALAAVLLAAAAPKADIKAMMKTSVDPAANAVFAVQGDVDPGNGPDAAKVPAARWSEGMTAAAKLKAAALKLEAPGMMRPDAVWKAESRKMAAAAEQARLAAASHDGAKFSDAANALGDTCTACHAKHRPTS